MIIQGITLTNTSVYDGSFNSNGALLYIDIGNTASYSGSGTSFTDLSGNANTGTSAGSPVYSGQYSGLMNFNGAGNQYIATSTAKYNKTYTGKTVFITARLTSITATTFRCLFGTASGTRNFNTYIYSPSNGVYQIHYSTAGGGGFSNNIPLQLGQWFTVAVIQDATGLTTYYFNGQPVGTTTGNTLTQWSSNGNENIGVGDNYWYGDIGICAIYGRALSSDEIQQNYNSISHRYDLDIIKTNLLANYDATTYTSGNLADISGNSRTLTLYNTPTTAKVNNATVLVFNGINQWGIDTTGYSTLLNTSSGFTYDLWVRPNSVSTGSLIVEYDNNTATSRWQDSQIAFVGTTINGGIYQGVNNPYITGPIYTAPGWYHIVLTYDGVNKTTLYVNGVSRGTTTSTKVNPPTATNLSLAKSDTTAIYLGGSTNYFVGQVGAWKIYTRALSSTEVSQNFQALRNRFGI
jgi:hypothetical protein